MGERVMYEFNKYQTPITEELKKELPKEVYNNIIEAISSVKYIKNLISKDRRYIKDMPPLSYVGENGENISYGDGRKEIDITNPHILEDLDFFRERALFFEKHNKYTHLVPNANPKSDYAMFWKEELRRWKHGLIRDDGEWIPGELYFYWNYAPIWLVEKDENAKGGKKGDRIKKFPKPWLGDYLFFHYINKAKEAGKHGKCLKTRGIGMEQPHSEIVKTINGDKLVGDVLVGDKLIGIDGKETTVLEIFPQGEKDVYEITLMDGRKVRCGIDHLWYVKDFTKADKKTPRAIKLSEIIRKGLYWVINDGKNKSYKYKIPEQSCVNYVEKDLPIHPYILGFLLGDGTLNGTTIKVATDDDFVVEKFKELLPDYKLFKDITNNNYFISDNNRFNITKDEFEKYENSQYGLNRLKREIDKLKLNTNCFGKFIPDVYKKSSREQRFELLQGLMDSDGYVNEKGSKEFSNSNYNLIKDVEEVVRSLGIKCRFGYGRPPRQKKIKGKETYCKQEYRLYINTNEVIFKLPRKIKRCNVREIFLDTPIVDIKKLDYKENSSCFLVDNNTHTYLTRDFIPTHNSFKAGAWSPRNMYVYPGSGNPNFHLASEKSFLSGDKGIWGKILDTLDWIANHTPFPRMRLVDGKRSMEVQLGYEDEYGIRCGNLSSVMCISLKDNPDKARGIRGPLIHYEEDGLFPNLESSWNINRKAVEDGGIAFGFQLAAGTGGVEGASFEGSEKLFYNPIAYNIFGVENVYDKNSEGGICGFFWPVYMNRNGCYDIETGEPDVIKTLIEVYKERFEIKHNSTDSSAITQKMAEDPITPQDAIMRVEGTVFPIAELKEYLESISVRKDSFLAQHYVGELIYDASGKVIWKPTDKKPLRKYDTALGDRSGSLEIFEMPRKNANGEIPRGRYIAGIDPIDSDSGQSLFSMQLMDTFTDRIVAEYTGRDKTAKHSYDIVLKALIFYNAEANYEQNLKGLFSYFEQKNALHYLCDTPQILKDMHFIKPATQFGNKAHPYSEKVYTPQGIKKWGDIKIGDQLFGSYGNITNIIDIPFNDKTDIYEVSLKDGRKVRASENHLWNVIDWSGRTKILSTGDILKNYYRHKGKYKEYKYYIPKNQGVEFKKRNIPMNPYLLGLMIGDGCFTNSKFHNLDFCSNLEDLKTYKKIIKKDIHTKDNRHHSIRFKNAGKILKKLDLLDKKSRTKFIPDLYKYNTKEIRLNLLKGLMDTDGMVCPYGNPSYCTVSYKLHSDVLEIARSLGINCNSNIFSNKFGKVYIIRFYTDIKLFNLKRKYKKQKLTKTRNRKTAICNIKKIGVEMAKCVTVDAKDNSYLIGDFIVTHNSKGTIANERINRWGRQLQADWQISPIENQEEGETKLNLHTLRGLAYIEECIKWNPNGNFDRVSSGIMLFIFREDRFKRTQSAIANQDKNIKSLSNDPFFTKNFNRRI